MDKPALVAEARVAIEFRFSSAIGKVYRIEDSPDLEHWETVESGVEGAGTVIRRFDYAAREVTEYRIADPEGATIGQYLLSDSVDCQLAAKQADGTLRGRAVAGFVMPVRAAFDDAGNLEALWALKF